MRHTTGLMAAVEDEGSGAEDKGAEVEVEGASAEGVADWSWAGRAVAASAARVDEKVAII